LLAYLQASVKSSLHARLLLAEMLWISVDKPEVVTQSWLLSTIASIINWGSRMAYRRRGRKRTSMIDDLLGLPWQFSVGLGVAVLLFLKGVFPAVAGGNMFMQPVAAAASNLAWLFSGAFFLIAAIVFTKEKISKGKNRAIEPTIRTSTPRQKVRQEPAYSPPTTAKPADINTRPDILDKLRSDSQQTSAATKAKPTEWSLEVIRDLEWKRFEDVCQQFYEKKGIRSDTTNLGPDGGIDIRLYQDESGRPTSIVQCKAWGERYVGVKPIRELLGVMTHEKIGKAFFMTSGSYSDEAKAVAQANRITLIDGNMLLMMIKRLPEPERESLLVFATDGDYAIPTCPSCGIKMVAKQGTNGRADFWGCQNYPRCRKTLGKRREQAG